MSDYPEPDGEVPSLSPRELHDRLQAGAATTLLDVRDRDEFEAWRIEGPGVEATQIPYVRFVQAEVTGDLPDGVAGLDEPVLVVCGEGKASAYVAERLADAGIEAQNLAGGMEAWARLDVAREVAAPVVPDDATVIQYQRPSSGCLSYLVHDGTTAAVVDPLRAFTDRYVEDCNERGPDLAFAVDTHVHADHVSGVRELADRTGATPVLPAGVRDRGLAFEDGVADRLRTVADGDSIAVGDLDLHATALPGHTTELVGYRIGGDGAPAAEATDTADGASLLLCGDTLFFGSVARPDLERGNEGPERLAGELHETLHDRVLAMPDGTLIAPGHYGAADRVADDGTYTAPLGELRERIDLLGLDREAFVERVTNDLPERPANFERIVAVNLGRETADEAAGFELELGPNNCAVS